MLSIPFSPTPSTKSKPSLSPPTFTTGTASEKLRLFPPPRPSPIGIFMPQALYRMAVFFWAPIFWFNKHPQPCRQTFGRDWLGRGFSTNAHTGTNQTFSSAPQSVTNIRCKVLWRQLRRLRRRRGGAAQTTRAWATTWLRVPMPPLRRARRRRPGLGGQHWLGRLAVSRAGLSRGVVPDCARQPHACHIPPCP